MRALILGLIALAGAAGIAVALPRSAGHAYILDTVEGHSVYAFVVGDRAAAARVDGCTGQLLSSPHQIVADLRARASREDTEERFNVVTVEGGGVHFGPCGARDADEDAEDDPQDTLVVIEDISARQTRRLINELQALSAADRAAMLETLELSR